MIELQKFTPLDFDTFVSWINNEKELFQFAGPIFTFPLSKGQLENYMKMEGLVPYKVVCTEINETIGHCELNYQKGNYRLSRILIGNKAYRGKGIGEKIVRKMVEKFFEDLEVDKVDLNVFDWNLAAIKCYENVGFKINPFYIRTMRVTGGTWVRLNMDLNRTQWNKTKDQP
jgi:RimJ/RimL family protein N-acetyltransferase